MIVQQPNDKQIYLNVYDLTEYNLYLHFLGLGAYHSGIQIGNSEYAFGSHNDSTTGVFQQKPKVPPQSNMVFREQIYLGETKFSSSEIKNVLDQLKQEFKGNSYNLLTKNCNHFTYEVARRLAVQKQPSHINRAATIIYYIKCCIPSKYLGGPDQLQIMQNDDESLLLNNKQIQKYPKNNNLNQQQSLKISEFFAKKYIQPEVEQQQLI